MFGASARRPELDYGELGVADVHPFAAYTLPTPQS
jgi:hypothetical protein